MIQALFVILGIGITLTWLTKLHSAVHCIYQWLVHGKRRALFPTYSIWSWSLHERQLLYHEYKSFLFPFLYMCRSICSQLWISCCTVTFILKKLFRLPNNSEWCRQCLKGRGMQKLPKLNSIKKLFGSALEEILLIWTCKHQPAKAHLCKNDPVGNTENFADLFNLSAWCILIHCLHLLWSPPIDLFSLYVLFSHFRPCDALMGICLLMFFH